MRKKLYIRMITDFIMTILLPLLMIQALAGEELHEWIGICMSILLIGHHLLNFNWYKNLFKGKYNIVRSVGTFINFGICICMILCAISGILLSQYAFVFLNINHSISFARVTHMICTHWMFALISLHLGMHIKVIKSYIELSLKRTLARIAIRIFNVLVIVISVYGLYVFIDMQIWQYMFYQAQFMFYDFDRVAFMVYFDYVAMMILFTTIGFLIFDKLKSISFVKKDWRQVG